LPEPGGGWTKGQFNLAGRIPVIEDPRVQFFKGRFDQTLPQYTLPAHDVLVINLDADIYSSTSYVLKHLTPEIAVGTYIYFDEFCKTDQEARAFDDFLKASGYKFQPVSADKTLTFVCFRRSA
jgi:macrocin-O-methyltransferase TylF-like protien